MPNQSGLWTLSQQFQARGQGLWPAPPGAPTIGTATAGNTTASVTFTAPACTGYPAGVTSYTVTSTPGCITASGASSPVSVTGLTNCTAYTFKVKAQNSSGLFGPCSAASNSVTPSAAGSQSYTTAGTYSWVAPAGVTSVSVVAVGGGGATWQSRCSGCYFLPVAGAGGGGLGYKNNYAVTPGNSYTVVVGAGGVKNASKCSPPTAAGTSYFVSTCVVSGKGGGIGTRAAAGCGICGASGGGYTGTGGGNGGSGGPAYSSLTHTVAYSGGGGGAGGYGGNGGNGTGQRLNGNAGSSGGGGGGASGGNGFQQSAGAGGGVGILGKGANGAGGQYNTNGISYGGGGGSCGTAGGNASYNGICGFYGGGSGGSYGGGGGGSAFSGVASNGGGGAVRIIWPGCKRSFPSTCAGNP